MQLLFRAEFLLKFIIVTFTITECSGHGVSCIQRKGVSSGTEPVGSMRSIISYCERGEKGKGCRRVKVNKGVDDVVVTRVHLRIVTSRSYGPANADCSVVTEI